MPFVHHFRQRSDQARLPWISTSIDLPCLSISRVSSRDGFSMCISWSGAVMPRASCNLGPLAVVAPLLEQMDVAAIMDRHLPPDPQLEFSHGQVLRMLLGARLSQPLALVNVAGWAEESGAEYLWGIPADKLNDDRLGRSLDAFFTQRHSILASVAAHVVHTFRLPMNRLHYDTT